MAVKVKLNKTPNWYYLEKSKKLKNNTVKGCPTLTNSKRTCNLAVKISFTNVWATVVYTDI